MKFIHFIAWYIKNPIEISIFSILKFWIELVRGQFDSIKIEIYWFQIFDKVVILGSKS